MPAYSRQEFAREYMRTSALIMLFATHCCGFDGLIIGRPITGWGCVGPMTCLGPVVIFDKIDWIALTRTRSIRNNP